MSIYHVDANTISLLFDRIQAIHSIPELTTELVVEAITKELSRSKSDLERSLLGQLVMFQDRSSLAEALSACTYNSQAHNTITYDSDNDEIHYVHEADTACCREINMLVRFYSLILNNRMEDFMTVRYAAEFCACTTDQLLLDIEPICVDGYVQSRGLTNPVLIEQYKALVLRATLLPVARAVFYAAMVKALGLTNSRKHSEYMWNIQDKIESNKLKLSMIPPERLDAFSDTVYKPIIATMQSDGNHRKAWRQHRETAKRQDQTLSYREWKFTILEQQVHRSSCSRLPEYVTMILYYKYCYQEPAVVPELVEFDLDLLVPSCDQMLIEI